MRAKGVGYRRATLAGPCSAASDFDCSASPPSARACSWQQRAGRRRAATQLPHSSRSRPAFAARQVSTPRSRGSPARATGGAGAALASARAQGLGISGRKVRVTVTPRPGSRAAARALVRSGGGAITGEADGRIDAVVWPGSLGRLAGAAAIADVRTPARPVLDDTGAAGGCGRRGDRRGRRGHERERLAGGGLRRRRREGRDRRRRLLRLHGRCSARGSRPRSRRSTTAAATSTTPPANGGTEHGTARRRDRPPDGAGRAALPHLRRQRGRPRAGGAGRGERGREGHQPLARLVQHEPRRRQRTAGHARRDRGGRAGARDPVGERAGRRDPALERQLRPERCSGELQRLRLGRPARHGPDPVGRRDLRGAEVGRLAASRRRTTTSCSTTRAPRRRRWSPARPTTSPAPRTRRRRSSVTTTHGPTRNFGIAIYRYSATATPALRPLRLRRRLAPVPGRRRQHDRARDVARRCWPSARTAGAPITTRARSSSTAPAARRSTAGSKPDLTAPDATSSSVYGANTGSCTSGFNGTSAATPHVAGAAALLLQRTPTLTPAGRRGRARGDGALAPVRRHRRHARSAPGTSGSAVLAPTGTVAFALAARRQPQRRLDDERGRNRASATSRRRRPGNGSVREPELVARRLEARVHVQLGRAVRRLHGARRTARGLTSALVDDGGAQYFNAAFTVGRLAALVRRRRPRSSSLDPRDARRRPRSRPARPRRGLPTGRRSRTSTAGARSRSSWRTRTAANVQVLNTGVSSYALEPPAGRPTARGSPSSHRRPRSGSRTRTGTGAHLRHEPGRARSGRRTGRTLALPEQRRTTLGSIARRRDGCDDAPPSFATGPADGLAWRPQLRTAPPASTVVPVGHRREEGRPAPADGHGQVGRGVAGAAVDVRLVALQRVRYRLRADRGCERQQLPARRPPTRD